MEVKTARVQKNEIPVFDISYRKFHSQYDGIYHSFFQKKKLFTNEKTI